MELKHTPLYQKHVENKARIVDFGGWAMPVEYESILKEAKSVRSSCGLFDASHMGEIRIRGRRAKDFLQKVISNDISLTQPGQLQYNIFLNHQGTVIDDLMVYNFGREYLCVVNASNTDKDFQWLKQNKIEDVEIINESGATSLLSLQGPRAYALMKEVAGREINLGYMTFAEEHISGKRILLSRSGYTGEDGFEIYSANDDALFLWDLLLEKGKKFGLTLCGLGSRDILRIEPGYSLYGHEISDEINPLEAGLSWAVKFNKDFIGKDKLLEIKGKGLARKRVGFIMQEKAVPRQGYPVYANASGGEPVGLVTSGTYSPNLDKFIGMALIGAGYALSGADIAVKVRDNFYKAKIEKLPFITPKTL